MSESKIYCAEFEDINSKDLLDVFNLNRKPIDNTKKLVPHLYWGNLSDPEYIILGKNPSYTIDDEIDCKYFYEDMIKNLDFSNHLNGYNKIIINLLSDTNYKFCLSNTSRWWKEALKNLKSDDANRLMEKVAIFNIFGYYSEGSSPDKAFTKEYLDMAHINKYLVNIRSIITNNKGSKIFIMWKGSIPAWEYLLDKDNNGFFDSIKDRIYIVNGKFYKNRVIEFDDELKINNFNFKSIK